MSASGKTSNYDIPIYVPGDTFAPVTSYSSAFNIVDEQMKKNETAAQSANNEITVIKTDLQNITNTVDNISDAAQNMIWTRPVINQAPGENSAPANLLAKSGNYMTGIVYLANTVSVNNLQETVIGGQSYYTFFTMAGNPLNINTGVDRAIPVGDIVYISGDKTYRGFMYAFFQNNITYITIRYTTSATGNVAERLGHFSYIIP